MNNINLIDSFQEYKEFKNIDRPTMMSVLEEVFRSMLRKKYGTDENCDIIVNTDNGDLEIWRSRRVMEDGFSEDDALEVEIAEAKLIVRDVRLTAIAVESKYGPDHPITKMFSERYDSYLDALAFYANKKAFAA